MTKKQAVFTIVACSIAALILLGVLAVGLNHDNFGISFLKQEGAGKRLTEGGSQYVYTWDPAEREVSGLKVEWVNGAVELVPGDGDVIRVSERSSRDLESGEKLSLSMKNGVLKIQWKRGFFPFSFFTDNLYKDLTVQVPRSVAGELSSLSCSTASGDVQASGFTAESFDFSTASGLMTLSDLSGADGKFSTVSGRLELERGSFSGDLEVSTTSGETELTGVSAQKAELSTVSGKIGYTGSAEEFHASSVSAPIRGELESRPVLAEMSAVSGDLALVLPENPGFEAEYSSVSGGFSCDFPVEGSSDRVRYGDGGARFSFSTTSGGISILKK